VDLPEYKFNRECVRRNCGEELDLLASLRPCTSTDSIHLSKYLGSSLCKLLVKLYLRCYSFMGSSSVLVANTLVEDPDKVRITLCNARVVVDGIDVVFRL
jgi:hypothetical protein